MVELTASRESVNVKPSHIRMSQKSCWERGGMCVILKIHRRKKKKAFNSFPLNFFLNSNRNKYSDKVSPIKYVKLKTEVHFKSLNSRIFSYFTLKFHFGIYDCKKKNTVNITLVYIQLSNHSQHLYFLTFIWWTLRFRNNGCDSVLTYTVREVSA